MKAISQLFTKYSCSLAHPFKVASPPLENDVQKTVAIIGAGPAGLVTAREMIRAGLRPTVFEKKASIGGLWSPHSIVCKETMRTNLSKFTCCFSDFPWQASASTFPTKSEMFAYLQSYVNNFLLEKAMLKLETTVTKVSAHQSEANKWLVQWTTVDEPEEAKSFDFVVVSTGIFSKPYMPEIEGISQIQHSSAYRCAKEFSGKNVTIVGSSFSAIEIASEIALYATSVSVITSRPFWILPRYLPLDVNSGSSPFIPLDLLFYRWSQRQSDKEVIFKNEDDFIKINSYFESLCTEQRAVSPCLAVDKKKPPFIVISDTFLKFIKDKKIACLVGKINRFEGSRLILDNQQEISAIDAVLFCTGYQTELAFLSEDIQKKLAFRADNLFCPLPLYFSMLSPDLHGFGFVGMYRGPYFAVMELQAKWLSALYAGKLKWPTKRQQIKGIRQEIAIANQKPRPQFPHSDYVGMAARLAKDLGIMPSPTSKKQHDIVIPASFQAAVPARKALQSFEKNYQAFLNGKGMAAAVFRAFSGTWQMQRQIIDKQDPSNSGGVEASASFSLHHNEHLALYEEKGIYHHSSGPLKISQKYAYGYDANNELLRCFFIREQGRLERFHELCFEPPSSERQSNWRAIGEHLCGKDTYKVSYEFFFKALILSHFNIVYHVQGPYKDYTLFSSYKPLSSSSIKRT